MCNPAAALWRVPLPPADQLVLERAFDGAPDLWPRIGGLCAGLVGLGVHGVFVRTFVDALRSIEPAGDSRQHVLRAAVASLEDLSCQR